MQIDGKNDNVTFRGIRGEEVLYSTKELHEGRFWSTIYLHRKNGPCSISVDGGEYWKVDGFLLTRIDGPNIINANGEHNG